MAKAKSVFIESPSFRLDSGNANGGKILALSPSEEASIIHRLSAKIDGSNPAVAPKSKLSYFLAWFAWREVRKNLKYLAVEVGHDIVHWIVDKLIYKDGVVSIHLPALGDVTEEEAQAAVDTLKDHILVRIKD